MILVSKRNQKAADNIIDMFKVFKDNPENGLINYTVKPCLVKGTLINENVELPFTIEFDEYIILVDFAIYRIGDKVNDSPGAKYISINEHNFNCDKIIREIKELL